MDFIAILVALIIERKTAFGKQLRAYPLPQQYVGFMKNLIKGDKLPAWLHLFLLLFPIVLLVAIVYVLFLAFFMGILALVFSIFILFYCLGSFPSLEHSEGMENIVVQANRNIFSVLFWFMVLGPVGAVLYRINSLLVSGNENEKLSGLAERFQMVLEWVPVRLEVLSYALMSQFSKVFPCFTKYLLRGLDDNEQFLIEACALSVSADAEHVAASTLKLLDNTLIVWMVIIAVIVLF